MENRDNSTDRGKRNFAHNGNLDKVAGETELPNNNGNTSKNKSIGTGKVIDKGFKQNTAAKPNGKKTKTIVLALLPLVVLAAMVYFLLSPYGQQMINIGIPLPQVTIEKVEFHENHITAFIRNTGPEEITISQADVNDRIQAAAIEPSKTLPRFSEARVIIPFLWNPGEPYEIGITTSDGTRFSKIVEAAAPVPVPTIEQVLLFAMLGIYVGVIPVFIGLAWYPIMRKISTNKYNFFLSLTAGLLVFLGADALLESNEIAGENLAATFNGQMLIFIVSVVTFLLLLYITEFFTKRATERQFNENYVPSSSSLQPSLSQSSADDNGLTAAATATTSNKTLDARRHQQQVQLEYRRQIAKPLAISMMVAIGIGLHNFGEGLAIGAAVLLGEVALSTFLIVGFTLHNTTEGLAIVAPMSKIGKLMIKRLIIMGMIAGAPTILGTWIGGFVYSPLASIIFLAIGAGAIFQVVYSIVQWMKQSMRTTNIKDGTGSMKMDTDVPSTLNASSAPIIAGFIVGILIMYITGLLI